MFSDEQEKVKPIVLNPVPITNAKLASRLGKAITTTSPSSPPSGKTDPQITLPEYGSFLSVSGQRLVNYKSKTDDLERYIAEIEASEEGEAANSTLPSIGGQTSKRGRRRYTDSRHPTSELPDVTSASTGAINESNHTVEKPVNRRRTQQFLAS